MPGMLEVVKALPVWEARKRSSEKRWRPGSGWSDTRGEKSRKENERMSTGDLSARSEKEQGEVSREEEGTWSTETRRTFLDALAGVSEGIEETGLSDVWETEDEDLHIEEGCWVCFGEFFWEKKKRIRAGRRRKEMKDAERGEWFDEASGQQGRGRVSNGIASRGTGRAENISE
jgi:hypothetical protein